MIDSLFNRLFFCAHRRTTFPLTPTRQGAAPTAKRTGTYVVCLDCGKEFPYNWKQLRIERPIENGAAPKSARRAFRDTAVAVFQPLARLWS
jgi:hypothetical protein